MEKIREMNRRCEMSAANGNACSFFDITVVNAEMQVSVDGEIRYLLAGWVKECGEEISFEISKESIWNYMKVTCDEPEWEEELRRIRQDSEAENTAQGKEKYQQQYRELVQVVKNKILEEGLLSQEELDYYDL